MFVASLFILTPTSWYKAEYEHNASNICDVYAWHDVVELVQPYLNETLYVALIMQGQSAEYHASVAASQAMDKSLPKEVQNILNLLIAAKC